jgi:hypothetical protein
VTLFAVGSIPLLGGAALASWAGPAPIEISLLHFMDELKQQVRRLIDREIRLE